MSQRNYSESGWPDFVPLPTYLPIGEAKRRAWRAFWRGIVIGGLMTGAAFIGGAAWGQDTVQIGRTLYINGSAAPSTTAKIEPSTNPGQLAVVTFFNAPVNDAGDNAEYFISIPDLVVGVTFTWEVAPGGADRITVFAPEGITCIPTDCTATVMEGATGQVVLLEWIGG